MRRAIFDKVSPLRVRCSFVVVLFASSVALSAPLFLILDVLLFTEVLSNEFVAGGVGLLTSRLYSDGSSNVVYCLIIRPLPHSSTTSISIKGLEIGCLELNLSTFLPFASLPTLILIFL